MSPQQRMLISLLTKPMTQVQRRRSVDWKPTTLEQLETLKDLDRETWGSDVAAQWNPQIFLVENWEGSKEALIQKIEEVG